MIRYIKNIMFCGFPVEGYQNNHRGKTQSCNPDKTTFGGIATMGLDQLLSPLAFPFSKVHSCILIWRRTAVLNHSSQRPLIIALGYHIVFFLIASNGQADDTVPVSSTFHFGLQPYGYKVSDRVLHLSRSTIFYLSFVPKGCANAVNPVLILLVTLSMNSVKTGYCQVSGTSLFYEISGGGELVVFLHGNPFDHSAWNSQVSWFSKACQVIRYD